eukprot:5228887-Amphidinium_carterae.1
MREESPIPRLVMHGNTNGTDQFRNIRGWLRNMSIASSTWSQTAQQDWARTVDGTHQDHPK